VTVNPTADKLLIRPGSRVLVLGAPHGYLERLQPLPAGAEVTEVGGGTADVVQLFARDRAGLEDRVAVALEAVRPGGVLWISYPKRSAKVATDLTRDVGWDALTAVGWRPVAQVSVDEVWSALRFRPRADVGR
jgi:hypothetical protein